MSTPLVEAKNLTRRRPTGRPLLDDVSLTIGPGMRIGVAGASGSGKTLLLRALALLDPVDSGSVCWRGDPVRHDAVPDFRRQVVYLHQRPAMLEQHVEAALRRPFSLRVHRRRRFDRDRVAEQLARLGRGSTFFDKPIANLSGGEMQIVALLRAVQLDPSVLLLDEPTAGLDPATAASVEELLADWLAELSDARAMVWVTHDAAQAARVARQIVHIDDGRIRHE